MILWIFVCFLKKPFSFFKWSNKTKQKSTRDDDSNKKAHTIKKNKNNLTGLRHIKSVAKQDYLKPGKEAKQKSLGKAFHRIGSIPKKVDLHITSSLTSARRDGHSEEALQRRPKRPGRFVREQVLRYVPRPPLFQSFRGHYSKLDLEANGKTGKLLLKCCVMWSPTAYFSQKTLCTSCSLQTIFKGTACFTVINQRVPSAWITVA